jgi:hypothetical protein
MEFVKIRIITVFKQEYWFDGHFLFLLQASRLLAASFVSESALTDTFIRKMPKDAFISDVLKE